MEYYCHIWTGDDKSPLYTLDSVQKRFHNFVYYFPPNTPTTYFTSPLVVYCSFHEKCSEKLYPPHVPISERHVTRTPELCPIARDLFLGTITILRER